MMSWCCPPLQRTRRWVCKIKDKREESEATAQWFLLAGRCDKHAWEAPDPERLAPIYPPDDRFWADPFVWSRGGRHFVFFEECHFRTRRGRISVLPIDRHGRPAGPSVPVIEESRHLSYPFLLELDGELYMVPESAESERIDLYHCVSFPHQWRYVRTLLSGLRAADSTLFEHEGRWWLFCSARLGKARLNNSLFAFFSDSPISTRWTPHAQNPLVRNFDGARPAGRIFRGSGGRLLRPSQNCVPRYGYGLNLSEIVDLTSSRFSESKVSRITANRLAGCRALHHLDWRDGLMVMDAQRLLRPGLRPRRWAG